jgi:hypothetical protein
VVLALWDRAGGRVDRRDELAAHLISEHSQAAHYLAFVYTGFTAIVIIIFAAQRISGGMPRGLGILDRVPCSRVVFKGLRLVLVLLSLGAAVMVFRVGDLGAKAVWQGRIQAAQPHPSAPRRPA